MTDIVERLRELADKGNAYTIGELWNGLDEAADEIDQLRARIAELEAQRVPDGDIISAVKQAIGRLADLRLIEWGGRSGQPWGDIAAIENFLSVSIQTRAEGAAAPQPDIGNPITESAAPVDEREAFEAWASGRGFDLSESWAVDGNNFESADTRLAYEIWQAARAQLGAVSQHPDDAAVDRFAAAMKAKLAKKRGDGRGGWETANAQYLSELLRSHVEKGDPLDVANLAMMLHQNGQSIVPALTATGGWDDSPEERFNHYLQTAIDSAPEPLRRLGEYLTSVLDEDRWPAAERLLNGACVRAVRAATGGRDELLGALSDAAQSLETISRQAGRDEFMDDMDDVRAYANSRARVAREALAAAQPAQESE